ncbi:MAG: flagellar basal body rod protein FlgB [Gammaproteobacteria bacterium]|jgi:flagellar basal-body rod protein FlgB
MRFDLDKVFGVHEQGVRIRERRAELLASNLANADTPNFKARDIDFKQVLQQAEAGTNIAPMKSTHAKHMHADGFAGGMNAELLYRNPLQPSVDGNTVDSQQEKAQFIQNAVQYQASLSFLSGKIKSLMSAIKGE